MVKFSQPHTLPFHDEFPCRPMLSEWRLAQEPVGRFYSGGSSSARGAYFLEAFGK